MKEISLAIVGIVGLPANYGGFETLTENLVKHHRAALFNSSVTVYCSSKSYPFKESTYLSARLKYMPFNANGVQSIPYDICSLLSAVWNRSDVILLLGVSGAIALPIVRLFSSARIITNIDGIEWRREKWKGLAKCYLRFSEKLAVHFSHEVIADNAAIAEYVQKTYGVNAHVIGYGGNHSVAVESSSVYELGLPKNYAFSVCRIEPENNIHLILEAFYKLTSNPIVIVGNWNNSVYGIALRKQYAMYEHLYMIDSIYDLSKLKSLRSGASIYIHGHSAGGTNPSLVEAMHFGKPILAFDCDFNRYTTEGNALFFKTSNTLMTLVESLDGDVAERVGDKMIEIAQRRYTWDVVAKQYFDLLNR